MRHLHPRRAAAALVSAALFAPLLTSLPAAATAAPAAATAATTSAAAVTSAATARPAIDWAACGSALPGLDCGTMPVPLDYDRPRGDQISLALIRRPADDKAARIGSLLLNPGGPGGSGVDFVAQAGNLLFTPRVRASFDLIGFDPRGVARSTGLQCFRTTEDQLAVLAPFAFPVTRAEEARWVIGHRLVSEACEKRGGPVIDHMSTANVARDMDQIRRALGEARMNYVGYSYGSLIGSTYANMFPDKVRALVIDGVVNPVSWTTGRGVEAETVPVFGRLGSEQGSYETFEQFLALCDAGGPTCAFSEGDPRQRFDRLARQLLREPAELPDGEGGTITVTYADLVAVTRVALYSAAVWPDLAALLADLDSAVVPARAAVTLQRLQTLLEPPPAAYEQVYEGLAGVACSDSDNPDNEIAWARSARRADERTPYFGRPWHWISSICASWPGADDDRYIGPWNRRTAQTVLVVGTRYDPATRYRGAVTTERLLGRARLLTVHAWGHTSLLTSTCADAATAAYLLKGELPAPGTVCEANSVPFAGAGGVDPDEAARVSALVRPQPLGGALAR
jgi:pimeloyl-ACP methyl ester carboxylesterase